MSTKRVKVEAGPKVKTREEMEDVVLNINILTQMRDQRTVEMDGELTAIREKYEEELVDLQARLDKFMAHAREWAENNLAEFGKAKSLFMTHGVVGFRTGMPQLKTLAGKTWKKIQQHLEELGNFYIRTRLEVDKEAILADREKLGKEQLSSMGLRVHQEETFYVEPKREQIESARQAV